jgi:pyrimidine-nucleoside phosphorylase
LNIVELIAKKREGQALSDDEIRFIIKEYAQDRMPAYQMAAMAMAIYFRGLDARETGTWTHAMLHSGRVLDMSELGPGRVDKHSTGGVGDKISLPLAPAAAACGVIVPMVAGRGLGHTGGTIDKLEAIPGYDAALPVDRFKAVLREVGCSIIGQTEEIAPADKRLYALRDVTATVESIPLICASIMGKKLAEGIEGLVLDIKVGSGAFMKTVESARELARAMIDVGTATGCRVVAILTRMDEPLGRLIGNSLEVEESVACLRGEGPPDIEELVVTLGGAMVELARGVSFEAGKEAIAASLRDGTALDRWERMVRAQGGDMAGLPRPTTSVVVSAQTAGFVTAIDSRELGMVATILGAGRQKSGDTIDPIVGMRVEAKVGDAVAPGTPLVTIFHNPQRPPTEAELARVLAAYEVGVVRPEPKPLIIERWG